MLGFILNSESAAWLARGMASPSFSEKSPSQASSIAFNLNVEGESSPDGSAVFSIYNQANALVYTSTLMLGSITESGPIALEVPVAEADGATSGVIKLRISGSMGHLVGNIIGVDGGTIGFSVEGNGSALLTVPFTVDEVGS